MRRKDREVPKEELQEIISKQKVCRLGLCRDNTPYVVPLNFGYELKEDKLILYFHCAKEGLKLDIIRENSKAFFEMDTCIEIITPEHLCSASAKYESVMGSGFIEILENPEDKVWGLECILKQCGYQHPKMPIEHTDSVAVLRLTSDCYSGKRGT